MCDLDFKMQGATLKISQFIFQECYVTNTVHIVTINTSANNCT